MFAVELPSHDKTYDLLSIDRMVVSIYYRRASSIFNWQAQHGLQNGSRHCIDVEFI